MPSKKKIIRTQDVTFNEQLFYNLKEPDLAELLQEEVENLVKIMNFHADSIKNFILNKNINLNSDLDEFLEND